MTQDQLDIISKDLVNTIKLLKGNPHESGLLFELDLIKNEMQIYNSNKTKNNLVKLILSGVISFFIGWISCSIFYLGLTPPIVKESKTITQTNIPVQKAQTLNNSIRFENMEEFESKFDEFQFIDKTFIYKGQIFKEGDVLGNIKIEYIIPDVHVRIWDIKEGHPFVMVITNK
ncbi:hypothetical protein [Arcobacter ellisii]|uniref:Uncharacterized protein n=1 Tax=Arcobacter ellisii TaxID=913109 RepID=A0A347UAN2_9BACT|nr:hypothetical protein [Arcobacter ellisii]AXX95910.1 hypothetical protein AELL_2284 [Arcobacter ellisii]RXI29768.1 hypothetical protein CP962_10400 [Arcobacter ellisii]